MRKIKKQIIMTMLTLVGVFFVQTDVFAISRDPGYSKDPRVVMMQNAQNMRGMSGRDVARRSGYVDGMSAYGAYFAEKMQLDPSGLAYIKRNKKSSTIDLFKGTFEIIQEEAISDTMGGKAGLNSVFKFELKKGCCDEIRFVQIVKTTVNGNDENFGKKKGYEDVDKVRTKTDKENSIMEEGILGGYYVDAFRTGAKPNKTIYYGDKQDSKRTFSGYRKADGSTKKAQMWDFPASNYTRTWAFETCAVCVDDGKYLGCFRWGFTMDKGDGSLDPKSGKRITNRWLGEGDNDPSDTFLKAVGNYQSYLKK